MPLLRLDRTLWFAVAALAGVFLLFEVTGIDVAVQDHLYDFENQRWLIDRDAPTLRFFFYDFPKLIIIFIGVALLALVAGPSRWHERLPRIAPDRRTLWIAFLTLGSVPALIGQLKGSTNVFCPSETRRYGGDVAYVRVLECYPANERPTREGRCFPAGHASGGFALLGLAGLARTRRQQWGAIILSASIGGLMGFYQMAKGAHYLSHTMITALIAWIGFLLWRRVLFRVGFRCR